MSDVPTGAKPAEERFVFTPYWQSLIVILLIALWPFAISYFASAIADLNACTIDIVGPSPCVVMGNDLGVLLYQMGTVLDLGLVFGGIGAMLGIVWLAILTLNYMTWRRKRSGVADATRMDVHFGWYAVTLAVILGLALGTVNGWLPAPLLLLALFMAIFWAFSFMFAVLSVWRGRMKAK